jgi:hypothetical protein
VIALATSRVFAMSAPGCVQPAAGRPVAAGVLPLTAVPGLDWQARVLGLLLLPEQPPAIKPAAATKRRAHHRGPAGSGRPG